MFQRVVVAAAVLAGLAAAPATAPAADRYAFANGCFTATDASGATVADRVFMKPTALGRYLLLRTDLTLVAAQRNGPLGTTTTPSPATDFTVGEAGGETYRLTPQSTGAPIATVTFAPAQGCAAFPEADLQASGEPSRGG